MGDGEGGEEERGGETEAREEAFGGRRGGMAGGKVVR